MKCPYCGNEMFTLGYYFIEAKAAKAFIENLMCERKTIIRGTAQVLIGGREFYTVFYAVCLKCDKIYMVLIGNEQYVVELGKPSYKLKNIIIAANIKDID